LYIEWRKFFSGLPSKDKRIGLNFEFGISSAVKGEKMIGMAVRELIPKTKTKGKCQIDLKRFLARL
jgi:hypothetical protein